MSTIVTSVNFPVLCIPRAMLFHTAEFVENAFNQAMGGRFVKTIQLTVTKDRSGSDFNVFFIHPDQDFAANGATKQLYATLRESGIVHISTGTGRYFWKVKLYVPHLKAQYLPPKPDAPVPVGPRIMTVQDVAEFEAWRREKAEREAREAAAKAFQALGERLYPLVSSHLSGDDSQHVGKVTGMILEMGQQEVEDLIASAEKLRDCVAEAMAVLREHFASQ
jgi:hypothetical protein